MLSIYRVCLINSFFSQWKYIESLFFDHNLLHAILTSNLKLTSKVIQKLLPLRSFTASFSALQNLLKRIVKHIYDLTSSSTTMASQCLEKNFLMPES